MYLIFIENSWKHSGKWWNCSLWAISPSATMLSHFVCCRCFKMYLQVVRFLHIWARQCENTSWHFCTVKVHITMSIYRDLSEFTQVDKKNPTCLWQLYENSIYLNPTVQTFRLIWIYTVLNKLVCILSPWTCWFMNKYLLIVDKWIAKSVHQIMIA